MFAPLQKKLDAMKKRKEEVDKEMKTKVCIIYLRTNSLVLMLDQDIFTLDKEKKARDPQDIL